MNFRYGWLVLCLLFGVFGSALAEEKYPQLLGDWVNQDHPNCSPCQFSITGVKKDGALVLTSILATDTVESWGRVTRDGKDINVVITMAGDSKFDLSPSHSGKFLKGMFYYRTRPSGGTPISFIRETKKKKKK